MNVYFTGSIAAKDKYLSHYQQIVDHLRRRGHTVTADHILDGAHERIQKATREERLEFHSQLEQWIKSCDFMIAETSFPSISVGYEISYALRLGRPVLVLYTEGDPPSLLGHHRDDKVVCEQYTIEKLPGIIDQFCSYIEGKGEMRFTFFITPQIASYLETVAKREKLPKAVYLRKLIEWHMKEKNEVPLTV